MYKLKHSFFLRKISFGFVMFSCFLLTAQDDVSPEPSLAEKMSYIQAYSDTLSIIYTEDLFHHYFSLAKIDSAIHFAHQKRKIAKEIDDKLHEFRSLSNLAICYTYHSTLKNPDSLKTYAYKAISFAQENQLQDVNLILSYLYMYLGQQAFYHEDEVEEAYRLYIKASELAEKSQDAHWYLRVCYNLTSIYALEGLNEKVIALVDDALEKSETFTGRKAKKYNKLWLKMLKAKALSPNFKNEEEKQWALTVFHQLIAEDERLSKEKDIMYVITDYLPIYKNILSQDSILIYSKRAVDILQKYPKNANMVNILFDHGKILFEYEKYEAALPVLDKAYQTYLTDGGEYSFKSEILSLLVPTYIKTGNNKKADELFSEYVVTKDSLAILEKENSIEKIETTYALEKSELERTNLLEKNQLIHTRSNLFAAIGVGLFFLLLLVFYLFRQQRKMKQHLEKVNTSKNQLFAILVHDIKGPAHAFDKLSEKINYLIKKNDYNRLVELAESFEQKGKQLSLLINNILNWAISQKDGIEVNPQRFPIKENIDEIVLEINQLIDDKNLTIENKISPNTTFTFDPNSFKIVMRNLLQNAAKFSYPHSKIYIEEDLNNNLLKIRDEGVGMKKEIIQQVLKGLPTKSQMGTHAEKGTGVGLSTCFTLARKNNAKIYVNSELKKGTTVTLKMMG